MITLKACRGFGLPLAQAQDVAQAVSCQSVPGVFGELIEILNAPVCKPMTVSDGLVFDAHILRDLPGLADAVLAGAGPFVLQATGSVAVATSIAHWAGISCTECELGLRLEPQVAPVEMTRCRVAICDAHWRDLEQLAAKILVPETDETRLSGAGAGLNDND